MRKGLMVLLVVVLAAAFALPAMAADIKASGFYRSKAWLSNFHDGYSAPSLRTGDAGDEEQTNAFVEQRFRVKFDFGNENVKAVWYLESDMLWGDVAGSNTQFSAPASSVQYGGAARNSGGALGADRIQTETKNIYVWFKLPDTSLDFTVGLQGQSDDYAGILYGGADMAGIFVNGKYEPVSYKLGWAKLYENDPKKTDDMTLYTVAVNFVPTKDAKMGVMFYFLQDDAAKNNTVQFTSTASGSALPAVGAYNFARKVYMPGINGSFKAGPATISGFLQYQTGKDTSVNPAISDRDITAYMGDLRADMNLGPGKFFVEGLYLSGGDDPADKYKAPITLATREGSPGGNSAYSRTGMEILLASPDTINVSQCLIGCSGGESGSDPGNGGRGIWHLAAGYQMAFSPKVSGNFNIGYLSATKKTKADDAAGRKGTDMGTELNARINYNIYKGLDVGLVAAYAFIGDFYNFSGSSDIKDAWTSNARINYSF